MNATSLKNALAVFCGGASYGAMAAITKLAYQAGFTWQQAAAGQATFGLVLFGVVLLGQMAFGKKLAPVNARSLAKLIGTGLTTFCTCILYSIALSRLPAAIAVIMLFQFTWVGIVMQTIATRRAPHAIEMIAAAIVMGGTLLASGLISGSTGQSLDPVGIVCGLLSSISCALFLFLSGRVETAMPSIQRGFLICIGSALGGVLICPTLIPSGAVISIAPFSLMHGLFSLFLPVILFGIGAPHLPTGIATILAASELPCSILFTFVILGEGIDLVQACGVAIILAGVAVSQLPSFARTSPG